MKEDMPCGMGMHVDKLERMSTEDTGGDGTSLTDKVWVVPGKGDTCSVELTYPRFGKVFKGGSKLKNLLSHARTRRWCTLPSRQSVCSGFGQSATPKVTHCAISAATGPARSSLSWSRRWWVETRTSRHHVVIERG